MISDLASLVGSVDFELIGKILAKLSNPRCI